MLNNPIKFKELGLRLAELSMAQLAEGFSLGGHSAAIVPVGSVEPHGPHLPLGTDTIISEAAALSAAQALRERDVFAVVAPSVSYGVTRFAEGFTGAVSIAPDVLSSLLNSMAGGLLLAGFAHVCFVNNHLEPDHDAAVRKGALGFAPGRCSVASPLTRRWAKTLSAEFKSGACHAGCYETSIVLRAAPELVNTAAAKALPDVSIRLSEGIKAGLLSFRAMGIEQAYTGSPQSATAEEGEQSLELLSAMVVTEVLEALAQVN